MANIWDYLLQLLKGKGDASSVAPAPPVNLDQEERAT